MIFTDTAALMVTEKIMALALFFETLELLQLRKTMRTDGIWSWATIKKDFETFSRPLQSFFALVFEYPNFLWVLVLRLAAAFLLILFPQPLFLYILFFCTVLGCLRWRGTIFGGSDFMTLIVLAALCVASFFQNSAILRTGCLWYIAVQACTSYFIAGFIKFKRSNWRNGKALSGILQSSIYGPSRLLRFFASTPGFMILASWALMVFECTFALGLLNHILCMALIFAGLLFHLANFYALGLNRFVWAWCATYPALYYCSTLHV